MRGDPLYDINENEAGRINFICEAFRFLAPSLITIANGRDVAIPNTFGLVYDILVSRALAAFAVQCFAFACASIDRSIDQREERLPPIEPSIHIYISKSKVDVRFTRMSRGCTVGYNYEYGVPTSIFRNGDEQPSRRARAAGDKKSNLAISRIDKAVIGDSIAIAQRSAAIEIIVYYGRIATRVYRSVGVDVGVGVGVGVRAA
ncbi:hypothetical protein V9T40_004637 [Parthenolecanium corni]|uniref:Uncharacterized protein n=1 Tax=Parthenolecanium corni TaxID=536013 RepID=A0AAN9TEF1_9HEMI